MTVNIVTYDLEVRRGTESIYWNFSYFANIVCQVGRLNIYRTRTTPLGQKTTTINTKNDMAVCNSLQTASNTNKYHHNIRLPLKEAGVFASPYLTSPHKCYFVHPPFLPPSHSVPASKQLGSERIWRVVSTGLGLQHQLINLSTPLATTSQGGPD